jgi:ribose transport system substrate-binding protein
MKRALIALAALPLLAGCNVGVKTEHRITPSNPVAAKITEADLAKVTKAQKPYKIVLIVKTRNNPFFLPMIQQFEQTAKALGAVPEVQAPPQEMDYEKQVALVQTEVGKGIDALCIAPADSKGIVPALVAAQKAGVTVINVDNRVDAEAASAQGLSLSGYVGADNVEGGRLAGKAMLDALAGKGRVAILEGIRGADNAEARKKGFSEAVQGKLEIVASESANWDTEQAYAKMQNLLAAHQDLNGVFCANDKMAVGAMKAIAESGRKGITVVGYDNIPDVQDALKSGALYATIEQNPDRKSVV